MTREDEKEVLILSFLVPMARSFFSTIRCFDVVIEAAHHRSQTSRAQLLLFDGNLTCVIIGKDDVPCRLLISSINHTPVNTDGNSRNSPVIMTSHERYCDCVGYVINHEDRIQLFIAR